MKKTIVLSSNTSWYLVNFRGNLIKRLVALGHTVIALAPTDDFTATLVELGCRFHHLKIDNMGTNFARELITLGRFAKAFFQEKPDYVFLFNPKPNIYGAFVAALFGIRSINNISGLGSVFTSKTLMTRLVMILYKVALWRAWMVFFQNLDDLQFFTKKKLVAPSRVGLLPGSGVDTTYFKPQEGMRTDGKVVFLFVGRLIHDKGVFHFVQAARLLKKKWPQTGFHIVGFIDSNNPSAVRQSDLQEWIAEGLITFHGRQNDVRPFIAEADCVVLPSIYREGTPRSLLEAASMGKVLIAADTIGCREPVEHDKTGFLCKGNDVSDLAKQMSKVVEIGNSGREVMGRRGREKMIREFSEELVIERYLKYV